MLKLVGLTSLRLPWADPFQSPPPPCPSRLVALGCADGGFNFVVRRRVELLFRE